MLFHLLAEVINDREVSQEKNAFVTARSVSWNHIIRLKNDPGTASALVKTMTSVCGTLPMTQAYGWKNRLDSMQQCFHFGSNCVCYRQQIESGVILLAECLILSERTKQSVSANGDPEILNAAFLVVENTLNGKLEVRCTPPDDEALKTTATTFGAEFLGMILKPEKGDLDRNTGMLEEKKSWWRKLLGS